MVLYQLVSGELPFSGDDVVLMQKILNEPHAPLSTKYKGCPVSLDAIVDRALAKLPEDRYETAGEMAADLSAAIAEIHEEQAQELLPEARRLLEAQDLLRARAALQQLLKMQSKNTEARELLGDIQRQLSQRQREERIQQLRQQAENLLDDKEFDQSLAIVDEGLELDAANRELTELRQRVEKAKEKQELVREYLRQADAARRGGDYKAAILAAREALRVDESNSKGILLVNLLTREADEAERRAAVKALLEAARGELNVRHYKEAVDVLHRAEQTDPTNPEVQLLLGDANSGLEQLRRKELVARLETEAFAAATIEQLQQCARSIQEAMAFMPTDTTLIRLNAQVDRQIGEQENRRFVEETIQACRDLRPKEALKLVQEARQRVPGEERLQGLEKLLADRVKRQTEEERREEIVSQAREALAGGKYADAVRILEGCQAEGIATDEILSLLEFARREEEEHRSQALTRSRVAQAQALIGESAYEEAIAFLESALKETTTRLCASFTNRLWRAARRSRSRLRRSWQMRASWRGKESRRRPSSTLRRSRLRSSGRSGCRRPSQRSGKSAKGRSSAPSAGRTQCWKPAFRRVSRLCGARRRPWAIPRLRARLQRRSREGCEPLPTARLPA